MTSTPPSSLRDLYTASSGSWDFRSGSSNGNGSVVTASTSSAPQWQRPSHNHVFDLSPSLGDSDLDSSGIDLRAATRNIVAAIMLRYLTTAIAMPWQVSQTLLQVQWMPRETETQQVHVHEEEHETEEDEQVCFP